MSKFARCGDRVAIIVGIALTTLFLGAAATSAITNSAHGFIDFNVYPFTDVGGDNVFTVNVAAQLPHKFSYFSLLNFSGQTDRNELTDVVNFYTEQNLRYALPDEIPFDLTMQWNMRSSEDNDRLRMGTRWKAHTTSFLKDLMAKLNLIYTLNYHYQFDHDSRTTWQLEHVYRVNVLPQILHDRLFVGGFADQTFQPDGVMWVAEHQVGVRVVENLYAVTEFRKNDFRTDDKNSTAVGFEYLIRW